MSPGLVAVVLATVAAHPGDLVVERAQRLSPRLREYTVQTPALPAPSVVRVLLPAGYSKQPRRRYPVLYLLHGCCDFALRGSQTWTERGDAARLTRRYELIVVMPDGGRGGWYSDWHRPGPPRWRTYHLGQLLPWVDRTFRTRAQAGGRAVAGLSMGGFGALDYAAARPRAFAAAASFSGAVDPDPGLVNAAATLDGAAPGDVSGTRRLRVPAERLRGVELFLRTGDGRRVGDGLETEVRAQTLRVHRRLARLRIPHVLDDYGPGTHTWAFWRRDLARTLPPLMRVFRREGTSGHASNG